MKASRASSHYLIFRTPSGCVYLYDAPTNSTHPWSERLDSQFTDRLYAATDEELGALIGNDDEDKEKLLFYVRLWRRKTGAFRRPDLPRYLRFRKLSDAPIERRGPVWMSDLVLTVSEDCNLRCAYCAYSSSYSSYRVHSRNLMSWGVARRAIDWFYRYNAEAVFRSYPDRNLNIVFYGGEPLLDFDLVRRATLYAEEAKQDHYGLVLSIGTNLTLLREEHLPFLRDHSIFLNVSLDGPPEEHNRYRLFENGGPTYDIVAANLERIRKFDEAYYFTRVRLLPTLNGNSDVPLVHAYFEKRKKELPPILMVSFLKDLPVSDFHRSHPYEVALFAQRIASVLGLYTKQKALGVRFSKGDFLYHFEEEALVRTYQRIQSLGRGSPEWYTGTCLPGRKLAVTPDGRLHICERINEHFPIGDVERGMVESQAVQVMDEYFGNLPGCHECWARNLCTVCYAGACDEGYFDFEHRCRSTREGVESSLVTLFSILERRPDAFASTDALTNPTAPG
ncbi:MAG: radical SAM protein [candidate division WOR-3 bacterium]|nr:radical SAM protein [candidate division WOR-3 bacterium]